MASVPQVELVLPTFNEGGRLGRYLGELLDRAAPSPRVQLTVVDDGSAPERAREHLAFVSAVEARLRTSGSPHRVRWLPLERNRGKGAAIREGWAAAPDCAWLGFLDSDGAVPAGEVWRLLSLLRPDPSFDVLAASRVRMAGREVRRQPLRHLQGRAFATLVELSLGLGFYDTQCGYKLFRAALLRPYLHALLEDRWMLDLELLALMRRLGGRLREEPVDWIDAGQSKLVFGVDALKMWLGLRELAQRDRAAEASGDSKRTRDAG